MKNNIVSLEDYKIRNHMHKILAEINSAQRLRKNKNSGVKQLKPIKNNIVQLRKAE